jgi:hypothetical protein
LSSISGEAEYDGLMKAIGWESLEAANLTASLVIWLGRGPVAVGELWDPVSASNSLLRARSSR